MIWATVLLIFLKRLLISSSRFGEHSPVGYDYVSWSVENERLQTWIDEAVIFTASQGGR